jgi:hypothetical protein
MDYGKLTFRERYKRDLDIRTLDAWIRFHYQSCFPKDRGIIESSLMCLGFSSGLYSNCLGFDGSEAPMYQKLEITQHWRGSNLYLVMMGIMAKGKEGLLLGRC